MKNLIRGHIYQLKKDHLFFGCLAISFVLLFVSIRLSLSLASVDNPVTGLEGLFDIFFSGDTVLYVFMLLTANMVAEAYRTGVMKNIFGRGIAKKHYYLSLAFTLTAVYLLVMLAGGMVMGVIAGSRFGMGGNSLSRLLCSFRTGARPFCHGAYQLRTYHDNLYQKCNYRLCSRPCGSEYPKNSGNGSGIFENSDRPRFYQTLYAYAVCLFGVQ